MKHKKLLRQLAWPVRDGSLSRRWGALGGGRAGALACSLAGRCAHALSGGSNMAARASLPLKETVVPKRPPERPVRRLTVTASDLQLHSGKSK